jgi:hypothetical protein
MHRLLVSTIALSAAFITACADRELGPTAPVNDKAAVFARNTNSAPGNPSGNESCDTKAKTTAKAKDINEKNSCSSPGSIAIVKTTNSATGTFTFTPSSNLEATTFALTPSDGNNYSASKSYSNLAASTTYTVTEAVQSAPWSLTSLTCSGGTNSTITTTGLGGRQASITLASGENITCTFMNTSSATVTWNFSALVSRGYPQTVRFEAAENRCTSINLDIVDYMAYSVQFGDQSGTWGFLNLCATTGKNSLWDNQDPPNDGKDYYVRLYTFNGSTTTAPPIVLTGDKEATCTLWASRGDGEWYSYCSIVKPRTTITGTLPPPA